MDFTQCCLYGIRSKKHLKYVLGIHGGLEPQKMIARQIKPYIEKNGEKRRLIEPPDHGVKIIQNRIKVHLSKIEVPANIFSGVKGKSYVDNGKLHKMGKYMYKIDLTSFFPSITRETVYNFFRSDMMCAQDVAKVLTDYTTVNLAYADCRNFNEVKLFLDDKGVNNTNHLISGAPTSQILSFLVNWKMFEELQQLADASKMVMSVYVDDIAFSSEWPISKMFCHNVRGVITGAGYQLSSGKEMLYSAKQPKLLTGVIITPDGQIKLRNKTSKKTIETLNYVKENPSDTEARLRLRGLVTAARQVEPRIFPQIQKYAYKNMMKKADA